MEQLAKLNAAMDCIEANLAGEIPLDQAAQLSGLTPEDFQQTFLTIAGMSLPEYIERRRNGFARKVFAGFVEATTIK